MIKPSIKNRINLLSIIAAVTLSRDDILKLYHDTGAPSNYKSAKHLTPKGVAKAQEILSKIHSLPYGYTEEFTDIKDGIEYQFIAKVEPHSNSKKGVSIYEKPSDSKIKSDLPLADNGKIKPEKDKFAEQFSSLSGQAREDYVIDYVKKYVNDIPMVPMTIKNPTDPNQWITVEVQPKHFSIEGLPVQISAETAEKIANILTQKTGKPHSLPTKEIIDATYQVATPFAFKWQEGRLDPDNSEKFLEYSRQVADLTKNTPFATGLLKTKFLPLEGQEQYLHSTGLLDGNLQKIQDWEGPTKHDKKYKDYSEGTQLVGQITLPNGEVMSLIDLIEKAKKDPNYREYASLVTKGKNYSSYLKDEIRDELDKFTAQANNRRANILKRAEKLVL